MTRKAPNSPAPPPLRWRGTVAWWHEIRGYGFIRPDDGGVDYFAHRTGRAMPASPAPGQRVKFEIIRGPCGPQAASVGPLFP